MWCDAFILMQIIHSKYYYCIDRWLAEWVKSKTGKPYYPPFEIFGNTEISYDIEDKGFNHVI